MVTGESGLPGQVWSPVLGLGEDADADLVRGDVDLGADEAVTHRFPACACGLVHQQVDRGRRRGRRRAIRIQAPHDRVVAHRCRDAQRALVGGRRSGPSPGARAELRVWNHSCESASASSAASRPEANGRAPASCGQKAPSSDPRKDSSIPSVMSSSGGGASRNVSRTVRGKVAVHLFRRRPTRRRPDPVLGWSCRRRRLHTRRVDSDRKNRAHPHAHGVGRIRVPVGSTSDPSLPARSRRSCCGGWRSTRSPLIVWMTSQTCSSRHR